MSNNIIYKFYEVTKNNIKYEFVKIKSFNSALYTIIVGSIFESEFMADTKEVFFNQIINSTLNLTEEEMFELKKSIDNIEQ